MNQFLPCQSLQVALRGWNGLHGVRGQTLSTLFLPCIASTPTVTLWSRMAAGYHHTYILASLEEQGQETHPSQQSLLKIAHNTEHSLTWLHPAPTEDGTYCILSRYIPERERGHWHFCIGDIWTRSGLHGSILFIQQIIY